MWKTRNVRSEKRQQMKYAKWAMGYDWYDPWEMRNAKWVTGMRKGKWEIENGKWEMQNGKGSGKWEMTN